MEKKNRLGFADDLALLVNNLNEAKRQLLELQTIAATYHLKKKQQIQNKLP